MRTFWETGLNCKSSKLIFKGPVALASSTRAHFAVCVTYFLSQHPPTSVTWMWVSKLIILVRPDFHRSSVVENWGHLGCIAVSLDEHCLPSDKPLQCTGLEIFTSAPLLQSACIPDMTVPGDALCWVLHKSCIILGAVWLFTFPVYKISVLWSCCIVWRELYHKLGYYVVLWLFVLFSGFSDFMNGQGMQLRFINGQGMELHFP